MERLTKYESIGGHAHATPTGSIDAALMRLASYEDTGLTPDDVDKYKKALGAQFKSLTAMKNKYVAMRNELCQYCGKYKQAHVGACDGCKWREM